MIRRALVFILTMSILRGFAPAQTPDVTKPEEKQKQEHAIARQQEKKAKHTNAVEIEGNRAFKEKDLRVQLKEQLATLDEYGLTSARADDVAFFLELFYRKHGYSKVSVHYKIESGDRLRLIVDEGPVMTLGTITFDGNAHEPADKLFDYMVGPTRERYSKLQETLPYVEADVREGVDLVGRLYVAEGFLNARIEKPQATVHEDTNVVDVLVPIQEGQQYFFGDVVFGGKTIYGAEGLRGQIVDLLEQPYTDARVADIPRRLQAYFKARGYYDVKVDAVADPSAATNGRVPVRITVAPGPVYKFGEASVTGLTRLNPGFVTKRFDSLAGKTYSPDVLDERFRTLMRTGLFNLLQIKPTPAGDDTLHLDISAEEAKSKTFGVSVGYGTYEGFIGGLEFGERDLFGTGRPITFSVEVSQRSYKGEIFYEDYFFLDTDVDLKNRAAALTFDYDGYSKFELGDRVELTKKLTKQYELGLILSARHVEITSADIKTRYLGDTSYFIDTIGFTQTFDRRESPLVSPRGFVGSTTFDAATSALGSEVDLVRGTIRLSYYLPFGPKSLTPGVVEDKRGSTFQRWFQQSGLAFGARAGIVHSLDDNNRREAYTLPIDERFFNGGSNTVRSFGERELGPIDNRGNPLGGEFETIFNVEYTFPIYGELQGALFADAGNLLPTSENPGLDNMRYALGIGLRYKLPIGPIRLDYGFNPDPHPREDAGAFHFSFGFAF